MKNIENLYTVIYSTVQLGNKEEMFPDAPNEDIPPISLLAQDILEVIHLGSREDCLDYIKNEINEIEKCGDLLFSANTYLVNEENDENEDIVGYSWAEEDLPNLFHSIRICSLDNSDDSILVQTITKIPKP